MDVNLHGACMGKLVGPAGGGGGLGSTGGGTSAQFRLLPSSKSSDCHSVEAEKVPVASQRSALHLKLSTPPAPPHRTFSPDPLKISDEYVSSGSSSPLADVTAGFLLNDAHPRVPPSLTGVLPGSPPSLEFTEMADALNYREAASQVAGTETFTALN